MTTHNEIFDVLTSDFINKNPQFKSLKSFGFPNFLIDINGKLYELPFDYLIIPNSSFYKNYINKKLAFIIGELFWSEKLNLINKSPFKEDILRHRNFHLIPINEKRSLYQLNPGFNNYLITSNGDFWYLDSIQKATPNPVKGYLRVSLIHSLTKQFVTKALHFLVAVCFIPVPNIYLKNGWTINTLQVNHKDGNTQNNHWANLEWCTPKENTHHAINTGLMKATAYSDTQIVQICELLQEGKTNIEISKITNIPSYYIHYIRKRRFRINISKKYNW